MSEMVPIETNLSYIGSDIFTASAEKSHGIQVTILKNRDCHPIAWSPLHLFVSAIETCFFATLQQALEKSETRLKSYHSKSVGELTSEDGTNKEISKVNVSVEIGLEKPEDEDRVRRIMNKVHKYCYVARSVKCPFKLEIMFV